MTRERIISALDVGSSKCVTLIASCPTDEQTQIIGVSSVPSRGVKKGVVVDIDEAVEAISQSLAQAERMAGYAVSEAYVVIDGQHISSVNSSGVIAVSQPNGEIGEGDVARVTEAARAISLPSSREIIHVIPRFFLVDGQEGVADPIGMSGVRLEAQAHLISGASTTIRNLVKCINQVGVDVESLVFGGIAAGESVLTDTERELGVALIDIGGGTTDLVLYLEGAPLYSSVLPVGGKHITNDLAIGLRLSLEDAESLKTFISGFKSPTLPVGMGSGAGFPHSSEKDEDEIDVTELKIPELKTVSRKFLRDGIIKPRLEEIFEEIEKDLIKSGFKNMLPAGAVLSGGGSLTLNALDVAKRVLKLPVRLSHPSGVSGLIEEISSPAYSAAVGTIIFAQKFTPLKRGGLQSLRFPKLGDYWKKGVEWIKGFLP